MFIAIPVNSQDSAQGDVGKAVAEAASAHSGNQFLAFDVRDESNHNTLRSVNVEVAPCDDLATEMLAGVSALAALHGVGDEFAALLDGSSEPKPGTNEQLGKMLTEKLHQQVFTESRQIATFLGENGYVDGPISLLDAVKSVHNAKVTRDLWLEMLEQASAPHREGATQAAKVNTALERLRGAKGALASWRWERLLTLAGMPQGKAQDDQVTELGRRLALYGRVFEGGNDQAVVEAYRDAVKVREDVEKQLAGGVAADSVTLTADALRALLDSNSALFSLIQALDLKPAEQPAEASADEVAAPAEPNSTRV